MNRAPLIALILIASPALANEFKLGLQLDEGGTPHSRAVVLQATAPQRERCMTQADAGDDCAAELMAAGEMLATSGAFDDAEKVARRAVAIMERLYGPTHADTTVVRGALGTILLRAGRYREAEPVLRAAVQGMQVQADGDPELMSDHLMNHGIILAELMRFDEAEPVMRRALTLRIEKLPDNVKAIATVRANLGVLLDRSGRDEAALKEHQAALAIRRDVFKGTDYDLGTSMLNIGENFARRTDGSRAVAEPYLRAGLMSREFQLPPGDPRTTLAQSMLGENLEGQGKVKAALEFYVLAYAGARVGSSAESPLYIRAGWNLARLLTATSVGMPMARTLYREAIGGVLARQARAQDFDTAARDEMNRYRGVFAGQVRICWALSAR